MPRFKSKVVEIDAVQVKAADYNAHRGCDHKTRHCTAWDSAPFSDYPDWLTAAIEQHKVIDHNRGGSDYAQWDIHTLEGVMTAQPGDWIIRGTEGELYPCKPSVFERKYEPA
jgi:hypothetical protein